VEVKNGVGGHHGVGFLGPPGEGGRGEHAQLEEAGVAHLDADLGGAQGGVENGADVADASGERAVGKCIQLDGRALAELQAGMSFS